MLVFLSVLTSCFATTEKAIKDTIYEKVLNILEEKDAFVIKHDMPKEDWQVYRLLKSGKYTFEKIHDPIKDRVERRITVSSRLNHNVIVPRESEKEVIVAYFYKRSKAEGARKLVQRISQTYSGISREYIQTWMNKNEAHCRTHPVFSNKPPLKPIVSHTVQSSNQIDLVVFDKCPVTRNGKTFKYILSL